MTVLLALFACTGAPPEDSPVQRSGVLDDGLLNPFPSAELAGEDALAIPEGLLPLAEGGTPMDVVRLNYRRGFSVAQPAIVRLPVELDAASVGGQLSLATDGPVRLVDLDTGEQLPCFAELDAHPDALDATDRRALIVRPGRAMTPGHRVAVVLTAALRTADGQPLGVLPAWTEAQAADPHYAELAGKLTALGVTDVSLAWDFPIGDNTATTRALAAAVTAPTAYSFQRTYDADTEEAGALPDGVWKRLEGTFTVQSWLADDVKFALDADGLPIQQGTAEAELYVHVPESVRGAAPSTVPIVVFGHGILSQPRNYFQTDDGSNVIRLSNELGAIVVATTWRGLTSDDQPEAIEAAMDFGRFHEITEKLGQGVANTVALMKLVREGPLLDDPLLAGLGDRDTLYYYGISLGGIEGAVTFANQDVASQGVFHVGGSAWSTMLERSTNWPPFELLVANGVPDPYDRQVLYAASQLLWDPVDPVSYAADLSTRDVLWQESIGDEQVPNFTTELLVRSASARLALPSVSAPVALESASLPARGPLVVQFDPQTPLPPPENRPYERTGAHDLPRRWDGALAQTLSFFRTGGEVLHFCGDRACAADNTGVFGDASDTGAE